MTVGLRSLPGRLVYRWLRATLKTKGLFESPGTDFSAGNAEQHPSTAGGPAAAGGTLREFNWHKGEQNGFFC